MLARRLVVVGMLAAALIAAAGPARAEFYLPFFGVIGGKPAEPLRTYQPTTRPEPRSVARPRPRPVVLKPPTASPQSAPSSPNPPGSNPSASTPNATPEPPVATQFTVAVLGDTMGELLAQGLKEAYADRPEIAVAKRARGSSGLVRDDFLDWPKTAREMAESGDKLDAVLVMLGSNDRQPIRDADGAQDVLNERWRSLYGKRVDDLIEPFRAKKIPVIWVGLPIAKNARAAADFLSFNAIFRERVQKAGMTYVDVWASFLDDADAYDAMGPDIAGQTRRLRSADGVYFTRSGARKLAFFTERELARLIEGKGPASPDPDAGVADANEQIKRELLAPPLLDSNLGIPPPEAALSPIFVAKPASGPVLPLTVPPVSPGATLASARPAGEVLNPAGDVATALRAGRAPRPKSGRGDDFSWEP